MVQVPPFGIVIMGSECPKSALYNTGKDASERYSFSKSSNEPSGENCDCSVKRPNTKPVIFLNQPICLHWHINRSMCAGVLVSSSSTKRIFPVMSGRYSVALRIRSVWRFPATTLPFAFPFLNTFIPSFFFFIRLSLSFLRKYKSSAKSGDDLTANLFSGLTHIFSKYSQVYSNGSGLANDITPGPEKVTKPVFVVMAVVKAVTSE